MITQNPIIGRSKNKLGNVYARTLWGKNILQTCPPPTKGHQTTTQIKVCNAFGRVANMASQVSPSLLNQIYYAAPQGRSRRSQWVKDLSTGRIKINEEWVLDPSMIEILGGNNKVSEEPYILTPASTSIEINSEALSSTTSADLTKTPCIILICVEANICISLLPFTTLEENTIYLNPLSTTLIGKECYLFPLWQTNVGTQSKPIWTYGRYEKNI